MWAALSTDDMLVAKVAMLVELMPANAREAFAAYVRNLLVLAYLGGQLHGAKELALRLSQMGKQ